MNADLVAQWEKVQIKTFTKWTNMHLAKCGRSIEDVTTGFTDGLDLIHLLQVISNETISRYNKSPKMRIQKIENLNTALKFIADHDVKLAGTGAEEIVDGNIKMTLGMIWVIILRFAISGLSEEGVSAKQGLLLWVQKKTQGYKGVDVKDFSESFKDGLAFDALIHKHRPDLLDYDSMDKSNPAGNLDAAFDAAEKLGVPKLLDTADIVDMERPDERSIMTYCAALYKVFSGYDKIDTASKRLGKFLSFSKQVQEMEHDYIERAQALTQNTTEKTDEFANAQMPDDYQSIRGLITSFKDYKKSQKRQWTAECSDLSSLYSNIQSKLRLMGRPPFTPPQGLTPLDLDNTVKKLSAVELTYRNTIAETMRQILERLRKSYAEIGNDLLARMNEFQLFLGTECDLPIEEQPQLYQTKRETFVESVGSRLGDLQAAEQACDEANIDENEYCQESFDDINYMYEELLRVVDKKLLFINGQILEAKGEVPADKIEEFRESFQMFDTDNNNRLDKLEFRSAATSLGLVDVDFSSGDNKQVDELFAKISCGEGFVSFENWVKYMTSITEDTCSMEQAAEAFDIVADGKAWITDADMERAHLSQDQVEYITNNMERNEHGYDYKGWLAKMQ